MGLNMKEKQAATREYRPRYQKAVKKETRVLLDEFTRLTGYHRKSAVRLLSYKPARELTVYGRGGAVKLKSEKKRPANCKGKRVYTDEVIASLRLVWTFFWYKCGKIPAPLRQQAGYIARQMAFNITGDIVEKLKAISPADIDRYLKKDREAFRLTGKSLTKPLLSLKSRIPIRVFYSGEERKTPGFRQIDAVHHCGQAASGQYILTLTTADAASGWMRTLVREFRSLLNTAHTWTFKALPYIKTSVPFPVLELHRKQSFRTITAPNLSTTPPKSGVKKKPSPSPVHETGRRTTTACGPLVRVEQKNGAVVREYIGYDRLEGFEEQALLSAACKPVVPLLNFFMPTQKLKSKTRVGSKEIKVYDEPRSPVHRLLEYAALPQDCKDTLNAQCALYNPMELQHNVNKAVLRLRRRIAQANCIRTQVRIASVTFFK